MPTYNVHVYKEYAVITHCYF